MKNIKDLLIKYYSFGLKEKEQKEKIINILKSFNLSFENKEVEIKNKVLILKITGPRKTEVVLNKKNILQALEGEIIDIN